VNDPQTRLVPKLRFPEFRETGEWHSEKIAELVDTVTPPKKLPTSSYGLVGKFPIIDQSQSEICGWTDDSDALIHENLPLIIFGDHTCALKFVRQPFAQGADGIKILKSRPKITASYLYQYLNYQPVITEEYKRHYSILKEKSVLFPQHKTGEQQKIADCLSSLDELIAAQARKVEALKTHKKGLMQQLFPREGETQPRLRFPQFQNAGEWDLTTVGRLVETGYLFPPKDGNHGNIHPKSSDYVTKGIPFIMASDLNGGLIDLEYCHFISKEQADTLQKGFAREGDVLLSHKGTVGEVAVVREINAPYLMLTPQVTYYRVKEHKKLSNEFLAQRFVSDAFQSNLVEVSGGGTRAYIGITEQAKLRLQLPKEINEQQRIASCLSGIDTLITAATQELDTLKTHKKGLMQQLFPQTSNEAAA
jgi:type I restriction enzyme, S subunit